MAAAVIFSAVSCAKEDISSTIGGGEVEVTFTANLAGLGTRAIADGNTVDRVYLAIFDAKSDTYLGELTADAGYPVSNGLATIPVVLLKDKEYDLVFWAQKDGTGAYTLDLEHRKVKANYGAAANNEARDAFFNISNDWTAGKDNTTFELRRPFAQINVGNSDDDVKFTKQNGSEIKQSAMTVTTMVYDTIELVNGSLTGTEVSAEFTLAAIPTETVKGTVDPTHDALLNASEEYNYLAMNYLLVNNRQLVDLVFNFTDGATTFVRKYFQVPVQRNYRTNILGQIISSPMDFNVIIVPDFNTPDSDLQGDTQTFNVSSKAELEDALAKAAGQNHIQHLIINLNADVALDVAAWQTLAIGNKNTKDITINGSKSRAADDYYTLTFNNTDSDWDNIATNGAKLILESLNITNSGYNDGPWNRHDINFACEVEMNNVVSDKALALKAGATLKNTTITENIASDVYAIWIQPNGQTVTLENCNIDTRAATDGRGIKIDEQYVDSPAKVVLNVSNTTFKTEEKSAILVKSAAGAEIVWGEGNNISKVAADKVNAVWVDEDAADTFDLVEVTGCTKMLEGALDSIIEDLKSGEDVTLTSNVTGSASKGGYSKAGIVLNGQTVDGGGHTLTVNGANSTWDCAVYHGGGTLKNITVAGAFRGVFTAGSSSDIILDNVIFKDVVYTFNSDDGNKEYGVYISNSTLNGWTSHSDVHKEVVYTNCSFGEGSGYAYCRPYGPTTFVRCNFCEGYTIEPLTEILLVDCKLNGVAITDANISDIATDPSKVKFAPVVNTTDALKNALETETYVKVAAGNYNTFPASSIKAGTTIECAEGTVFTGNSKLNINGATVIGAKFSNPTGTAVDQTINGTFKNCTFEGSNGLRWCNAGETVVFEECVFSGSLYGIHFDGGANDVIFRNCTISGFNALGGALTLVTFENCTFVGNGKSGYNGANLWGSAKLVNCEFTFNGTTANEWIDCIGADKTYEFENCTINGVAYTAENYKSYDSIFSRSNVTVKINGVDCAM